MADKQMVKWLLGQLPEWVNNGLIDEAQAERFAAYYNDHPKKEDSRLDPGIIAISIVGALLIMGGVISIVAYNWEKLDQSMRLLISFVPVIAGMGLYVFTYFKKRASLAWRESATAVCMLSLGSSIALYLQTMGMVVDQQTLLRPWMILSIPVVYGMGSGLGMLIYFYLITLWTLEVARPNSSYYWLLLSVAFPYLWRYFSRPGQEIRKQLLSWAFILSWGFGWLAAIPWHAPEYTILGTSIWLGVFGGLYLLLPYAPNGVSFKNPFGIISLAGIFLLVMIGAFQQDIGGFSWQGMWQDKEYTLLGLWLNFIVWLAVMVVWGMMGWRLYRSKSTQWTAWMGWCFPLFAGVYILLAGNYAHGKAGMVAANLFGALFGLAYLWQGINRHQLSALNIGLLFVLGLALERFFDSDWSLVVKGVAFIVLGIFFLSANLYFVRRNKKHGEDPGEAEMQNT